MSAKRKHGVMDNEGNQPSPATNGIDNDLSQIHEWLQDVLVILKRHGSSSSILDRELPSPTQDKPSPKRQKPSETFKTTIAHKVTKNLYDAVGDLVTDLDQAIASLCQELQVEHEDDNLSAAEFQKEREQAYTVKARVQALIKGEQFLRPKTFGKIQAVSTRSEEPVSAPEAGVTNKTILTLCGGERSARQLFSSLPKSSSGNFTDIPLPNGISFTDVVPVHSLSENREKVPTFGESFPPSASLKQINPPRPSSSRHTATRSLSVHWHNPTEIPTSTKEATARDPYFKQPLPTGRWLTYNVAPSTDQMTSPNAKRRHRDRALSTGEPQSAIDAETSAAHAQVKNDAMFRSVFSSFAPTKDDYGAIVPQEQKNRIWWLKHGEERFHEVLQIRDEELYGPYEMESELSEEVIDDKLVEEELEKMNSTMASGDPITKPPNGSEGPLTEISELLEVLHSHQKIRNLSQSVSTRPLQGQKEPSSAILQDHLSPSDKEVEIYENLKDQLATVIADLPPYLLAKVDGEKLGALTTNTRIRIPGRHQRGVLQPDNIPKPRVAPAPYPANPTSTTTTSLRGTYGSTPSQQYSQRPTYTQTPVARPAAPTTYSSYSARPPVPQSQYQGTQPRPAYNQYTQTPQQRAASYVDRFANGQLGGGAGGAPTPQYSQYSSSYRPQLGQHGYSAGAYNSPQPRVGAPTPTAGLAQGYARTPGTGAPSYSYHNNNATGPPAPSVSPNPTPTHGGAFGSQYAAPNNAGQRPPLYHQHSSHYGSKSPAAQVNGGDGGARMSPAAGVEGAKQGSIPPQTGGTGQGGQNGTPGPRENGVAA